MRIRATILVATAAASAMLVGPGQALGGTITSGSWIMDQTNADPLFPDGYAGGYGQVDIVADSDTGVVEFTVDAFFVDLYVPAPEDANFGIQSFGFNTTSAVTSTPDQWDVALPNQWWSQDDDGGQLDGFGFFICSEDGSGPAGQLRQDPLVFTITLPVGTESQAVAANFAAPSSFPTPEGEVFFAAHVAGFEAAVVDENGNPVASHFIGGPLIPEPATLALCLAGLGLLAWRRRRFT